MRLEPLDDRLREHLHLSDSGAFLARTVNAKTNISTDVYVCCIAQVMQHAIPRLLALCSGSAHEPAGPLNKRVELQKAESRYRTVHMSK